MNKQERIERLLPNGKPRYVSCHWIRRKTKRFAYMGETGIPFDNITVQFTRLHLGYYLYLSLSEDGGYCWDEGKIGNFCPGGGRVKFDDLPDKVKAAVIDAYKDIWEI